MTLSGRNLAEELLALHLWELPLSYFKRQYLYAKPRKFRADFAVWAGSRRVLIEVVGGVYSRQAHGSITGVLADNDRLNAATLNGWQLLRFTPQQVEDGTAKEIIKQWLIGSKLLEEKL